MVYLCKIAIIFASFLNLKAARTELENKHSVLLMQTKVPSAVTFYFKPSPVALESIALPPQLNLGFLHRI